MQLNEAVFQDALKMLLISLSIIKLPAIVLV